MGDSTEEHQYVATENWLQKFFLIESLCKVVKDINSAIDVKMVEYRKTVLLIYKPVGRQLLMQASVGTQVKKVICSEIERQSIIKGPL